MSNIEIDKTTLRMLKRGLLGNYARAAKELDTTVASISRFLDGKQYNEKFLEPLVNLRNKLIEEKAERAEKMKYLRKKMQTS